MGLHSSNELLMRCPNGYSDFSKDMKKLNKLGWSIDKRFNFIFNIKAEKSKAVWISKKLWRLKGGVKLYLTLISGDVKG